MRPQGTVPGVWRAAGQRCDRDPVLSALPQGLHVVELSRSHTQIGWLSGQLASTWKFSDPACSSLHVAPAVLHAKEGERGGLGLLRHVAGVPLARPREVRAHENIRLPQVAWPATGVQSVVC